MQYHELDELPSGIYTLTFYSVPARTSDMSYQPGVAQSGFSHKPFCVDKMVKKNIVKSARFVIP